MPNEVKVCPKCSSTDVVVESGNALTDIGGVTPVWGCQHCGYTGAMATIDSEKAAELKTRNEKGDGKD